MASVELFVGAGGLALGLAQAGFAPVALVEKDEYACETIRINQANKYPLVSNWNILQGDVKLFDYKNIKQSVQLVSGGPPCQPFSLGGKHKAYNDHRDLFPEAIRAVRELHPECFIFENVKGLNRQSFSNYKEYIRLQLTHPEIIRKKNESWTDHCSRLERHHTSNSQSDIKYNVVIKLLDAANYGVPQRRERLFFVGFRADLDIRWNFPRPTHSEEALLYAQWVTGEYWDAHKIGKKERPSHSTSLKKKVELLKKDGKLKTLPWKTVRDALLGLPDPEKERHLAQTIPNHEYRPGARIYQGHTGSLLDFPSKTLKAGDHGVPGGENMMVRLDGSVRYYTVRESARIQTFPDEYLFHGSWTETMRQLGNAVPVALAKCVANSVQEHLVRN